MFRFLIASFKKTQPVHPRAMGSADDLARVEFERLFRDDLAALSRTAPGSRDARRGGTDPAHV